MVKGQPHSRHSWIGELTLRGIREILSELVAVRAATDPNIYYMDGLQLFNETEALTMPDGIHPDAVGYRTIAANFVERVPKAWLAN
jgi:lysophospholipase L1-like esterase